MPRALDFDDMDDEVKTEVNRILTEFEQYCYGIYQGVTDYDKGVAELAIIQLIEGIIGEDGENRVRNALRDSQRAALKDLVGEV